MNRYLKLRDRSYFVDKEKEQFLVSTIFPIIKVSTLEIHKGNYWFTYEGMHMRADTTACVALSELFGQSVVHKANHLVTGKLGGADAAFGLTNTPFVFVYWNRVPAKDENGKQVGFPYAFTSVYDLN